MKMIEKVVEKGEEGIENAKYRRKGFLVALVIFVIFTIVVLLKVRELNKRRSVTQ